VTRVVAVLNLVGVISALTLGLLIERAKGVTPPAQMGSVGGLSSPPLAASLQIGEKLTYSVSWGNFVVAGRITTEVKEPGRYFEREVLPLVVHAQTIGLVRTLLIAIDDQFVSYVDREKLLPFRAEKEIREGKRTSNSFTVFDRKRSSARLSSGRALRIERETRDLVSLLYYIRLLEFGDGKTYRLPALHDRDKFTVHVKARNKAKVETPAGRFDAVELALTLEEDKGHVSDDYRLRIWISDDERRLPVLMTATPSFGEVRIELTEMTESKRRSRTFTDSDLTRRKTRLPLSPIPLRGCLRSG